MEGKTIEFGVLQEHGSPPQGHVLFFFFQSGEAYNFWASCSAAVGGERERKRAFLIIKEKKES